MVWINIENEEWRKSLISSTLLALIAVVIHYIMYLSSLFTYIDISNSMYRFFSIDEPDSGTQNCVAFVSNGPGFWVDNACTTLHPYVCERCKFVRPKEK